MVFDKKKYDKKWRENNKDKIKGYKKEWYQKNKEELKAERNKPENKEKRKEYGKEWREENLDYKKNWRKRNPNYYKDYYNEKLKRNPENIKKRRERDKKNYWKDRKKAKSKYKKYIQKPGVKEKRRKYNKKWCENNPEYHKEYHKEYQRIRKQKDKNFKIACNLRICIWSALKKYSKTGKIMSSKKYGIDYKAIIEHLKPFPKNIENYEVDHIIPLSKFDLNSLKHVKIAFSPENHQWLTKRQNRIKSNKLSYLKS